jgi:ABC-type lipoprotein release transport system permease subunit
MILRLAARNLRRGGWRTALAGAALALSTALLVVTLALVEGLFAGMVRGATRRGDGDAVVVRRTRSSYGIPAPIADADAVADALRRLPGVAAASPRLRIQGVLLGGERRGAAQIVGIDPTAEAGVTDLQQLLVEGGPLGGRGGADALLGGLLARRLGVRAGDEVVLLTRGSDGLPVTERLRVAGLLATGDPRRDGTLVLAGIGRVAAIAGLPGAAHEIGLALAAPGLAALAGSLPPGADLVAIPWQERLPALAHAVRFSRASSWWLIALFHAAAGLVALIVLLLGAHERRHEHGVWLALGIPTAVLRRVIAAEALVLGAAAVLAGSLAGALVAVPLRTHGIDLSGTLGPVGYAGGTILPVLHAALRPGDLLRSGGTLLGVCALAAWAAGARVGRLEPARVIAGRDAA